MENLKFLLDYFKEHATRLKGTLEKEVEKKLNDRKLMDVTEKCVSAHFQEKFQGVQACVAEEKALFQFCMKWSGSKKSIRDDIDSIESQIDKASSAYDSTHDLDGSTRETIENLHEQYFQLQA